MEPLTYLTTYATDFGALEWVFFIAQIAVALGGAYLAFLREDSNALRRGLLQQLGYGLLLIGGLGTLVGVLRLAGVALLSMPIWITFVTILEVALVAYSLYYALSIYPARRAALAEASRSKGARRSPARSQPALHSNGASGASAYHAPRPVATTTRRESRRERKRRGR